MKNVLAENDAHLSLYIDGRYCECNVHSLPYLKGSVIMLPLRLVAHELGYKNEANSDLGYDLVYRDTAFEKDCLTVRYVRNEHGKIRLSYYAHRGQLIPLPPIEMLDDELFVPMELFSTALQCTCKVSSSGNINVRLRTDKPDTSPEKLLSKSE